MRPHDFLAVAGALAEHGRGRPRQVFLRRAISSMYYALFHCLARSCADTLIGGDGSTRSRPAWRQVYRALEHGAAKNACKNAAVMRKFPDPIRDLAEIFVQSQEKRHGADYDPAGPHFQKSEVLQAIKMAEAAIRAFEREAVRDRRAFAAHLLLRQR